MEGSEKMEQDIDLNNLSTHHQPLQSLKYSEASEFKYGMLVITFSLLFYLLLQRILIYFGRPASVLSDPWKWRNIFVSWINSGICGSWVIYCFLSTPDMFDDLFTQHSFSSYILVSFSTGYFYFDALDVLVNKKLFSQWEVILHHIAVLGIFTYNVYYSVCIGFSVVALATEVNTFFLHLRKLMQMLHVSYSHKFYRFNAALNIITFAVCRGVPLYMITYNIIYSTHLTPIQWWILAVSMLIMDVINPILFWRLLKNDFLRTDYKYKTISQNGNNNLFKNVDEANHKELLTKQD